MWSTRAYLRCVRGRKRTVNERRARIRIVRFRFVVSRYWIGPDSTRRDVDPQHGTRSRRLPWFSSAKRRLPTLHIIRIITRAPRRSADKPVTGTPFVFIYFFGPKISISRFAVGTFCSSSRSQRYEYESSTFLSADDVKKAIIFWSGNGPRNPYESLGCVISHCRSRCKPVYARV